MVNRIGAELGSTSSGQSAATPLDHSMEGCLSPDADGEMVEWLIREAGAEDEVARQFCSDLARIAGALGRGDLAARLAGTSTAEFAEVSEARDNAVTELRAKALELKRASEDITEATATGGEALKVAGRHSTDWKTRMSEAFERASTCSQETSALVETIAALEVRTTRLALQAADEAERAVSLSRGLGVVAEQLGQLALHSAETARNTTKLTAEAVNGARRSGTLGSTVRRYLTAIDDRIGRFRELSAGW